MKSVSSTPSSAQKAKRSHLSEFLPLYRKFGDSKTDVSSETSEKNEFQSKSPKHQQPNKHQEKKAMDLSLITIDGTSLNGGDINSTPLSDSRTSSTPLGRKKSGKVDKKLKNSLSVDHSMTMDNDVSVSKSQKRSKSVSFLIEDNDQATVKKPRSDDAQDTGIGDTPQKVKKNKKNKTEKENKDVQLQEVETITEPEKKKKYVQSIPDKNEKGDVENFNNKKLKKQKKVEKQKESTEKTPEKPKKAKKQKHQHIDEDVDEPASKSPKTEFVDNLESLNLGDNTHTLTNLIDEMTVVDKAKKKKLKKTNRDKKLKDSENNDMESEVKDETQEESDSKENEKKIWIAKRWNKHQVAEKSQKTTVNVDNLPVSLLKGNFKKMLIDHFSKYGIERGVGEAVIQNEGEPNAVFTTKVHFDTEEAAKQALEMDGSDLAGNAIRVSAMRPMTETNLVIRIYGHPEKLTNRDVLAALGDVGLIRSIKPTLRKKKTMTTAFVEFEGPEAVKRALKKCVSLKIGGKQVMANQYTIRTFENKNVDKKDIKTEGKKKKRRRGTKKAQNGPKNGKTISIKQDVESNK